MVALVNNEALLRPDLFAHEKLRFIHIAAVKKPSFFLGPEAARCPTRVIYPLNELQG